MEPRWPDQKKEKKRELDIRHTGTKSMWSDVNTKPVQGALFRIFRSYIMGVPVECHNDVERRRTHPLLLPIIDTERVSLPDGDILKKIAVGVPVKRVAKSGPVDRERSIQGIKRKSILTIEKPSEKRRSVLGEPKYVPGYEPQWKAGSERYPAFYKALLDDPSRTKRIEMVRVRCDISSTRNQYYQDGSIDIVGMCEYL